MFRTRDFVLLAVTIVFLLVAISGTILKSRSTQPAVAVPPQLTTTSEPTYQAEVYVPPSLTREEKVAALREKIAESKELTLSAPAAAESEFSAPATSTAEEEIKVEESVLLCANYQQFSGLWSPYGVQTDVTEAARIFYREIISEYEADPAATTTVELPPEVSREVLLQLPTQPQLLAEKSCLTADVVGIAKDGSLIKNNEAGLYGVFGAETLVGYALDGLPIYGTSNLPPDSCGGVVVNGQYGYYLPPERSEILRCFSAQPINF